MALEVSLPAIGTAITLAFMAMFAFQHLIN